MWVELLGNYCIGSTVVDRTPRNNCIGSTVVGRNPRKLFTRQREGEYHIEFMQMREKSEPES